MNESKSHFLIGSKFYTYFEGDTEATVYRLVKYKESKDYYTLVNLLDGKYRYVEGRELRGTDSKFTMLNPDGLMSFTIVTMDDGSKDVIVCVHDIHDLNGIPKCVCRQCAEDIFINKTTIYNGNNFHIGISISQESCPQNVNYGVFLACSEANHMVATSVYLDDTMDDFKKYIFPGINLKKFDLVLKNTQAKIEHDYNGNVHGACGSLTELLEQNMFMHDFHTSFNVHELYIDIKDGDERIDDKYFDEFAKYIAKPVTETYVLKYSRDFSLDKIKRDYILVNPLINQNKNIYVVGYDLKDEKFYTGDHYNELK